MDYQLEQWINGGAGSHPAWDMVMVGVAAYGQFAFAAVIGLWFLAGWLRGQAIDRQGALAALLATGWALATNKAIQLVWSRPRPFAAHPQSVHLLLGHAPEGGFPSDHAAVGMAIAVVLWSVHRRLGLTAMALAAVMGFARVYVGDHYPGTSWAA